MGREGGGGGRHKYFTKKINIYTFILNLGARCSSVVRAFAHGAIGRLIDPSCAISRSSQCSTTGVTKAVVCIMLSD